MPHHRIRHRYPLYWKALAYYVKFVRECGLCQICGARHGEKWVRRQRDGHMFRTEFLARVASKYGCAEWIEDIYSGYPDDYTGSTIVLTCAHADHGHTNHHPDNLLALCSGCHLDYDRLDNRQRFRTNFWKKRGQLSLFKQAS